MGGPGGPGGPGGGMFSDNEHGMGSIALLSSLGITCLLGASLCVVLRCQCHTVPSNSTCITTRA